MRTACYIEHFRYWAKSTDLANTMGLEKDTIQHPTMRTACYFEHFHHWVKSTDLANTRGLGKDHSLEIAPSFALRKALKTSQSLSAAAEDVTHAEGKVLTNKTVVDAFTASSEAPFGSLPAEERFTVNKYVNLCKTAPGEHFRHGTAISNVFCTASRPPAKLAVWYMCGTPFDTDDDESA